MKFKKGDTIICINNDQNEDWFKQSLMDIGERYIVKKSDGKILFVEGIKSIYPYSCKRFVTLQEYRINKIQKIKDGIQSRG